MSQVPECQKYACAIQDCLGKNNYQESKCTEALKALEVCCQQLLDNGGSSACCPKRKYSKEAREGNKKSTQN
ncbi:mature T-cell proliferation 1 neighbor protein-like protein [Phycomyces blakesleeanus]|uniref:Cx9C motif-containing protein 4, mitochondrial n=1 Tax=Phycomyces blakesleeanus TaxID=4837 RepID=A0ABR3AUU1_PHYBL